MRSAPAQTTNEGALGSAYSTPKPIQPPPNTLASHLLVLLKEGRALTSPDFQNLTGSWRLAAVVFTLKELNWPVQSVRIAAPSYSNPRREIALYFMAKF